MATNTRQRRWLTDACIYDSFDEEAPVSPLSGPRQSTIHPSARDGPSVSRRDSFRHPALRKEVENVDYIGNQVPSISRELPVNTLKQVPSSGSGSSNTPANSLLSADRSFFDDSVDHQSYSSTFRPSTSRSGMSDGPEGGWYDDGRRPSVASASTVGSQESTSRVRQAKKLKTFFGEDPTGFDSPHGSDVSLRNFGPTTAATNHLRTRQNSFPSNFDGRAISPANSRPRSPLPSSDTAPWMYQDFKVRIFVYFVATRGHNSPLLPFSVVYDEALLGCMPLCQDG